MSFVLLTRSDAYVQGLNAYRYGEDGRDGVKRWLMVFLEAVEVTVAQASRFAQELTDLQREWTDRHGRSRESQGKRRQARSSSAVVRLLQQLPEVPLVTARTVERLLDVSFPAARAAVEELASAGVLTPRQVGRNTTGYLAREVFELLTLAERHLASTRWDTRQAAPARPVPALPRPTG
ncbi:MULTISPECIES: hypothetical protein [Protofrankia]|uniref:hypothetical protein n=1 Tax=Protofrankia TaxID=2994361 RepID=UPI000A50CAF9|nr:MULTISPECIES: hypothetical protein [Protofrankia]